MNAARVLILAAAGSLVAAACGHTGGTTGNTMGSGALSGTGGSTGGSGTGATTTMPGTGGGSGGDGGGTGGSAPSCATDGWLTYNHDAARTGASGGCVNGPLSTTWRYVPAPPSGKTFKGVFNAVAQPDGAFLAWSASDDPYLGTTAADKVGLTGARVWTFDSGTDSMLGNWPTVAFGGLVLNDDGIYYLDGATGTKTAGNGVDNWGQTLTDGTDLYAVNDSHVDGPDIYVGSYDSTCKQLWTQNKYGMCRIDAGDIAGGLALDAGVLFYAPSYSPGMGVQLGFDSGVYAFNPTSGLKTWFVAATPTSGLSAGGGLLYLIEGGNTLTARKETDGSVAWSAMVTGAGTQAPVLAAGKVFIASSSGVSAYDAKTGAPAWSTPITGGAAGAFDLMFSGGCVGGSGQWSGSEFGTPVATTTLAAAAGSGTLVVTALDGLHVLSLASGTDTWHGMPAQAMGQIKNPVVVGHTVYVIDGGGLLSLQAM